MSKKFYIIGAVILFIFIIISTFVCMCVISKNDERTFEEYTDNGNTTINRNQQDVMNDIKANNAYVEFFETKYNIQISSTNIQEYRAGVYPVIDLYDNMGVTCGALCIIEDSYYFDYKDIHEYGRFSEQKGSFEFIEDTDTNDYVSNIITAVDSIDKDSINVDLSIVDSSNELIVDIIYITLDGIIKIRNLDKSTSFIVDTINEEANSIRVISSSIDIVIDIYITDDYDYYYTIS